MKTCFRSPWGPWLLQYLRALYALWCTSLTHINNNMIIIVFLSYLCSWHSPNTTRYLLTTSRSFYYHDIPHHIDEITYLSVVDQNIIMHRWSVSQILPTLSTIRWSPGQRLIILNYSNVNNWDESKTGVIAEVLKLGKAFIIAIHLQLVLGAITINNW